MNAPSGAGLQTVILIFCAVVLLYSAWRGWRLGVVRAVLNLAIFTVAYFIGLAAAHTLLPVFRWILPLPDIGIMLLIGGIVGIIVCIALFLLSAVLFKRTAHHRSPVLKLFFGIGGALVGIIFGLLVLWSCISLVRLAGVVAESRESRPSRGVRDRVAKKAVELKRSLEEGPSGAVIESVDVLPPEFYRTLAKIARVTTSEASMQRFLDYPGLAPIIEHPRMVALLSDPEVNELALQKNYLGLMTQKSVIEAVNDPDLAEKLRTVDLEKALDYALEVENKPSPPSP